MYLNLKYKVFLRDVGILICALLPKQKNAMLLFISRMKEDIPKMLSSCVTEVSNHITCLLIVN